MQEQINKFMLEQAEKNGVMQADIAHIKAAVDDIQDAIKSISVVPRNEYDTTIKAIEGIHQDHEHRISELEDKEMLREQSVWARFRVEIEKKIVTITVTFILAVFGYLAVIYYTNFIQQHAANEKTTYVARRGRLFK
jgi:hypothetical protein|nr:MAG TPA: hypothetical protein [Caudoviricetes sp.]